MHSVSASGWLVGCFGFSDPLRQYFSLYQAVSQRERKKREKIDERKNVQTSPTVVYRVGILDHFSMTGGADQP